MLPFVSLDGATGTGAGATRDLESSYGRHSMIVTSTGSPTSAAVALEGSHDGVTWVVLTTATFGNPSDPYVSYVDGERVVRYIRANVTQLVGGTAPTFTATIASA